MIESIKKEVAAMEESITYQEILERAELGQLADARELVLLSADRFGKPDEVIVKTINSIADVRACTILVRRSR
jgi:hypothetical protein